MTKKNFSIKDGDLFHNGKYVANGFVRIQSAYTRPGQMTPEVVCGILQTSSCRQTEIVLPIEQWRTHILQTKFRYFACVEPRLFDLYLATLLDQALPGNTFIPKGASPIPIGTLISAPGLHCLPNGTICAAMGNTVIGAGSSNILLTEPMKKFYIPDGVETPLLKLSRILLTQPPAVTLAASLAFFSVIRSACLQEVDFQGVGYIMGPSAVGKTYLAKQLFGFVGETGTAHFQPANVFESQTSTAGFLNAMTDARDLPIVLDDIALSGSRDSQRKRADLAANIIREGANAAKIVKSGPGSQRRNAECLSTVIITAELSLQALSELNRCILIPIRDPLNLPDALTPKLMGSSILAFLRYFIALHNSSGRIYWDLCAILSPNSPNPDQRVLKNFDVLHCVMDLVLCAARQEGLEEKEHICLRKHLQKGVLQSFNTYLQEKKRILSTIPQGNLAWIIQKGLFIDKAFKLKKCRNYKKLEKLISRSCDGIWWKGSLCLFPKALELYIQRQNGYADYSTKRIGKELALLDLLHLHNESTYTVKIHTDFPRVYRIKMDRLEEAAKEF